MQFMLIGHMLPDRIRKFFIVRSCKRIYKIMEHFTGSEPVRDMTVLFLLFPHMDHIFFTAVVIMTAEIVASGTDEVRKWVDIRGNVAEYKGQSFRR